MTQEHLAGRQEEGERDNRNKALLVLVARLDSVLSEDSWIGRRRRCRKKENMLLSVECRLQFHLIFLR